LKTIAIASLILAFSVPVAKAAPCTYDMSPLPVTKGVVSRVAPSGVLLRDGTTVILPEELMSGIRVGHTLAVRGLLSRQGHTVRALALDGVPPVCPAAEAEARGPFPGAAGYDQIRNGVSEKSE